jgi:hypothetical protein
MKPYLIILLTLLIGFSAGFLTNGYLTRQRMEHLRRFMEQGERFEQRLIGDLALDPDTEALVQPILRAHFETLQQAHQRYRQEVRSELAALREALAPHLNEAQLRILRENLRHKGPKGPRRGDRGHAPPGGPQPPME